MPAKIRSQPALEGFSFDALLESETKEASVDLGLAEPVILTFWPRKVSPDLLDRINQIDSTRKEAVEAKDTSRLYDTEGKSKHGVIMALCECVREWNIPDMPWGEDALRRLGFGVLLKLWTGLQDAMLDPNDESESETSFDVT